MHPFFVALSLVACNLDNHFVVEHSDTDWDNDGIVDSVDPVVPVTSWIWDTKPSYALVLPTPELVESKKFNKVDLNKVTYVITDLETAKAIFGGL